MSAKSVTIRTPKRVRAFSLAELLVVIGVIALLIALIVPPLRMAQLQAMRVQCGARLAQIGVGLEAANSEFRFYPYWDDSGAHVRFTWLDVLVQRRLLGDYKVGYCPMDQLPDPVNAMRGRAFKAYYPGPTMQYGVDYSFGISAALSAGGWRVASVRPGDDAPRRFEDHERFASSRVLAGDATWTCIYNLSGGYLDTGVWNEPGWYDNVIAWRHSETSANLLMQDGHVEKLNYRRGAAEPVNTSRTFVWYPGEPINVGPDSRHNGFLYPDQTPPRFDSTPPGDTFPSPLLPSFYSSREGWTLITHKQP